ncbi:MAG TPA: type II toxin-antitoxin system PemK/MazF family toxin [Actinomycetota bacterium]|nr:type II toxin-antitoxin system PemK/MazF family toxin [Actinomycetota bacterium]
MVAQRAEIYWADLGPPVNRRPVCVLTRDAAIAVLSTVTCAPITRTVRRIRSEVEVGPEQGLPEASAINCDNLVTIRQSALDPEPVGRLDQVKWAQLDRALRYALDIRY